MLETEKYIKIFQKFEFDGGIGTEDKKQLKEFKTLIDGSNYRKRKHYIEQIQKIKEEFEDLPSIGARAYILEFRKIQQRLISLTNQIIEENKKVFIVHGRDINMRDKIEAFLSKLHIENVILEHETNQGHTIIEKFLKKSSDCQFAIVLFSPDDCGGLSTEKTNQKFRVRQNVILELGYFLGKIGRENILILHPDEIEIEKPSDVDGVVHIPYDNKGAWKHKLIKELKQSKFYIDESDINKV